MDVYKSLLKKLVKKWYFFLISFLITLSFGHYIYKSSSPLFTNRVMLSLAEDEGRNRRNAGEFIQIEMFNTQSNLEDELAIISSFPVINKTLKELDITVSYFLREGLYIKEVYKESPFKVIIDSSHVQPIDLMFEVEILSDKKFNLKVNSEGEFLLYNYKEEESTGNSIINPKFEGEFYFNKNIEFKNSKFKLLLDSNFVYDPLNKRKRYFQFNDVEQKTYQYKGDLTISRLNGQSSMIFLEIKGGNSDLIADFLNTLARVYLNKNLEKKNTKAEKTIEFINEQIAGVADSLNFTASKLKDFRTANKVMDINYTSQNLYQQLQELENQKAAIVLKQNYYLNIKDYFENNKSLTDLFAPSSMGVEDPQLINLITQLTELNSQRSAYLENKNLNNPNLPNINSKIKNLKKTIQENIIYNNAQSEITKGDIDERISELINQINKLPITEKELRYIEREFNINDATYTYLLQKRSEAEIASASNSPDYEVIEAAKLSSSKQVSPKKEMIYFSAFFLGLMIPIGIVMVSSVFNNTISDKREIESLSNFQIIESIARNDKKTMLPTIDYPTSLISESFRAARTSLQFFRKKKKIQKILITSSVSGDGKSFIAMNLAVAFSFYGKKTLLIEYDLRKPKLAEYLELELKDGLSSCLADNAKLDDIIHKTNINNLDVIATGVIPPSPVELIASDNTKEIFKTLEKQYDYIIIDTPPVGIVTDSYLLMDYVDVNLYVVRLNHTNKKMFSAMIKDIEQKGISDLGIIINDDDEQAESVYYEKDTEASYFVKKFRKLKDLI